MSRSRLSARLSLAGALGAALALAWVAGPGRVPTAHACGCFAPPDPTTPIVQAGERILFAMQDGVVTAHIQIQYDGSAEEFAWLVPMPAVPTLELGTDELFTQVIQTTQPRYRLMTEFPDGCEPLPAPPPPSAPPEDGGGDSPVVTEDSIGPYDFAVLEADDKQPMLDWLSANRYFVPTGTSDAVDPYIRPGGYFLALKLRKGQTAGDLQPIVVKYQSQLPQIPIVLTSVAADPDMPVLVWVLGEHRAIPRNFFHTQVNDALIDWINNGLNYIEVVTAAVDEANGHHSFVTEYAGTSNIMVDVLDPPGRFGDPDALRALTAPADFLEYLWINGYAQSSGSPFGGQQISSQIVTILDRALPMPQNLVDAVRADYGYDLPQADFYFNFRYYLELYPDILTGAYPEFSPVMVAGELETRIVVPTRAAGQLFRDSPYLTRLFTTLSPDEMTRDPVFSFNPDLPEVSNLHWGTLEYLECDLSGSFPDFNGPALLVTEQGWQLYLPEGQAGNDWLNAPLPASYRIEMLREEGAAQVVTDNADAITDGVGDYHPQPQPPVVEPPRERSGGCTASPGAGGSAGALLLAGLAVALLRRRRA
jgi:MYXO-CTERM domain-containing protein